MQVLALPVASCLVTRAAIGSVKEDGSRAFVIRPYTPINAETKGTLDLCVVPLLYSRVVSLRGASIEVARAGIALLPGLPFLACLPGLLSFAAMIEAPWC